MVEERKVEVKGPEKEEETEEEKDIFSEYEKKESSNILAYSAVVLIVVLGLGYFFLYSDSGDDAPSELVDLAPIIACHKDSDCSVKGKIGICSNPGEGIAECNYFDDAEVRVTVLNSNDCFNCDTGRVLSIMENFYPNLVVEVQDFGTDQGKEIADNFDVNSLPAYILSSELTETHNFEKLSGAFDQIDGNFIMKRNAANSNYYLDREEIPFKLDFFVQANQDASLKAERNLNIFLGAFESDVEFEKHTSNSRLVKELGINSFPAFLINNKNKFAGVHAADQIKENFCMLNSLTECNLELSKNLIN